LPRTS